MNVHELVNRREVLKVEQIYTKCLSEASYLVISGQEAAVIDPIRETEPYLRLAAEEGAQIKYIFETHFHADFVSGHLDLAKATGATIVFGPSAQPGYAAHVAADGEEFAVGAVKLRVLHTPGHTLESSCFLLFDEEGKADSVFTGDTLFVGEVGRPDLAVESGLSREDLAGMLFDSLRSKIVVLPDETVVYPGHGAGSACGKNIGSELTTTIGTQKANNYALQSMSKEAFVKAVTEGLVPPPSYFFEDAKMNKHGYEAIDEVMKCSVKALSMEEFEAAVEGGALVLDTRDPELFAQGFVHGSLNIGLGGQFAVWAGTLIDIDQSVVIVADPMKEHESILRLARVGYGKVVGYLEGGISMWEAAGRPLDRIETVTAEEAAEIVRKQTAETLDVRDPSESQVGHIDGAKNIRLPELPERMNEIIDDVAYLVYCQGGYRSMIACSLLARANYGGDASHTFTNVNGGFQALEAVGAPVVYGKRPDQLRQEKMETGG